MPDSAFILSLPNGLEVIMDREKGFFRLRSFRIRRPGTFVMTGPHTDASNELRARHFGTFDEVVSALRAELAR